MLRKGGDTIVVAQGNYVETVNFRGKNIVLTSADPNSETKPTLRPAENRTPAVIFSGSEGPQCVLRGLFIFDAECKRDQRQRHEGHYQRLFHRNERGGYL